MKPSKRNNNKGLIGTLIFHSILLLLFFFTGLSYTIPPPPEEGISINFGNTETANGNNVNQEEKSELNTPKKTESNTKRCVLPCRFRRTNTHRFYENC